MSESIKININDEENSSSKAAGHKAKRKTRASSTGKKNSSQASKVSSRSGTGKKKTRPDKNKASSESDSGKTDNSTKIRVTDGDSAQTETPVKPAEDRSGKAAANADISPVAVENRAKSFRAKIEEALEEVEEGGEAAADDDNIAELEKENSSVKDVINQSLREDWEKTSVESSSSQKKPVKHSVRLYRKISFFFVALTVILLAFIFYFSFASVVITLVPNQTKVSNNLLFDVVDNSQEKSGTYSISGMVKLLDIETDDTYQATGEEIIGEEVVGQARIINNYSKNQPLVAKTRLLSPEQHLYRITETVNVPAGGSVTVDIYADEPSQDVVVGKTNFIIPGLWAGLQDKIYATTEEGTVYRKKIESYLTREDIDNAVRDLKQRILAKAKQEIGSGSESAREVLYRISENSPDYEVGAEIGDEVSEFTARMSSDVAVVAFARDDALRLAEQKLKSSLGQDKKFLELQQDSVVFSLDNYNSNDSTATINAVFEGKVSLADDSRIVDVDKILGLNESQLKAYLNNLEGIAGYQVEYYPSFIKRVPHLTDRVEVVIE